jgi:hypothetical protein
MLTIGALIGRAETVDQVAAWADRLATTVALAPQADGTVTSRCDATWRTVPVTVICD